MVVINKENCKGCARCADACPKKCLEIGEELNAMGIKAVRYKGEGCISCGICFYNCTEPYAIKVEKEARK
jgi:NAD-dependent dihydropyrimidine dehydrogenase PreA subunit